MRRWAANRQGRDDSQRASGAGAGADGVGAGGGGDATGAGGQLANACSGSATIVARLDLGVHLETFSADWPLVDGLVEWAGRADSLTHLGGHPGTEALGHWQPDNFQAPSHRASLSIGPQVLGVIAWSIHHFLHSD